jgi:hypothetical protein
MTRLAESTTEANASASGTASSTAAAAGDLDSVGEVAAMPAVESRLIKQVELLLRESGNTEPFDAAAEGMVGALVAPPQPCPRRRRPRALPAHVWRRGLALQPDRRNGGGLVHVIRRR